PRGGPDPARRARAGVGARPGHRASRSQARERHAGAIKVLDFGIAKWVEAPTLASAPADHEAAMAVSSALAGTRPYMSPEQLNLEAVDHRADVWAVGILIGHDREIEQARFSP